MVFIHVIVHVYVYVYTLFLIPKKLSDVTRSPAQTGRIFGNVRNAIIIPIKLRLHILRQTKRLKNL